MSNNYTQFSFAMPVKGLKAKAWINRMIDKIVEASNADTEEPGDEILELFPDWEHYLDCGFRTEMEPTPGKRNQFELVIFAEESGNVEHAANFAQAILRRFDPKGVVGFQWAETSDRATPDSFGGGAAVVTATSTKFMSSYSWLQRELKKLTK